jgi:hypothetical protein
MKVSFGSADAVVIFFFGLNFAHWLLGNFYAGLSGVPDNQIFD